MGPRPRGSQGSQEWPAHHLPLLLGEPWAGRGQKSAKGTCCPAATKAGWFRGVMDLTCACTRKVASPHTRAQPCSFVEIFRFWKVLVLGDPRERTSGQR